MKNKLVLMVALSFSLAGFAQKAEIKAADKALKNGSIAEAKTALESAASLIAAADARVQAQYYFLKGKTYAELGKKGDASSFETAAAAYKKVISIEEASGKSKYSAETNQLISVMISELVSSAVEDNSSSKFKEAGEKLYMSYGLSPKDTTYLYYAASSAVNGQHYEQALVYYQELMDIGYNGSGMRYTAVNVESGETEEIGKVERDLYVKSGSYKDPKDEKEPAKTSEIVKNVALIYTQLGDNDKAMEAYKVAREQNPKDVNLILSEANLYYKLDDKEKFKSLMAEAADLAPDNADLHYNIGVINMEQGNLEEARVAYKRALEVDPNYMNALLNLSTTYVNEGNGLIDQMNELSASFKKTDIAKYDALKQQKDDFFVIGAKILEDALENNSDNKGLLNQLKNIYGALGDDDNFLRLKKMIGDE